MNKLFQILLVAMAITVVMPTMAQEDKAALKMQKAKEKAEKKEANKQKRQAKLQAYQWDWDGTLSGNETFDDYLKTVTDIWNDILTFETMFGSYVYKSDTLYNEETGKLYVLSYMQDTLGNTITRNQSNWQIANSVAAATTIVLEATTASLATANATLALTEMGLGAIAFAKYIKGGPMVIARGMSEIGDIAKRNKVTARQWKAAKAGAIDPATLGMFTDAEIVNMNKCCYLKEIVDTDPMKQIWIEMHKTKSPEQLAAEAASRTDFANTQVLPEDANQSLDDESFDAADFEDA